MWIGTLLVLTVLFVCRSIAEIPDCPYFDTVELTNNNLLNNGSYQYNDLIIPIEQTAEYNYEILGDGTNHTVPKHLRGCVCKRGTCVRFCCHRNLMLVESERKCSGDIEKAAEFDFLVNVTLANGSQVKKHIFNDFIVQQHLPVPCAEHHHFNKWTLFENGTLLDSHNAIVPKREYCFQPQMINTPNGDPVLTLVPHGCDAPYPSQTQFHILRVITIICLLLTIFVYLWLPKLRTLHGYCFICYMLCIIVAYTLYMIDDCASRELSLFVCKANGYGGYFAVMSGFLWLTVISYDLWRSFRGNNYNVHRYTSKSRFLMYSLYVWSVVAILTIIVIIVDNVFDINNVHQAAWMPGVVRNYCWIKADDWSAMIYLFGPMSLEIIFNITMFVLTFIRILEVKRELKNIATPEERQNKHNSKKQSYWLFVRLFVIMGVTWIFEIFAYLTQGQIVLGNFAYVFKYINCSQGIIIFFIFVIKRSVLKLIMERIRGIEAPVEEQSIEEEIPLEERNGGVKNIGPSILH